MIRIDPSYGSSADGLVGFMVYHTLLSHTSSLVFVDELWVHPDQRGLGRAGGMIREASRGGGGVELMVRVDGRKGIESERDPVIAYARLGLIGGAKGRRAEQSKYAGVKGCLYMRGCVREKQGSATSLEAVGSVHHLLSLKSLEQAGFLPLILEIVAKAHGKSADEARESVVGSGLLRYVVVVSHNRAC